MYHIGKGILEGSMKNDLAGWFLNAFFTIITTFKVSFYYYKKNSKILHLKAQSSEILLEMKFKQKKREFPTWNHSYRFICI